MSTFSTIPAFKAAFVSRLQADSSIGAAATPVLVTYGYPSIGSRTLPREWVYVGDTQPEDPTNGASEYRGGQSTGAMGQLRREERYVLDVVVAVTGSGIDGQQVVTERAFTIGAAIETSLRTWQAQANAIDLIVRWALVVSVSHKEGVTENGDNSCAVTILVACAARL